MSISLVLFDRFACRVDLFPLVSTRPIGNLRIGALTLDEKWSKIFNTNVSYLTEDYLSKKFPLVISSNPSLVIKSSILPNDNLIKVLKELKINQRLIDENNEWIAFLTNSKSKEDIISDIDASSFEDVYFVNQYVEIKYPEDIFIQNSSQIEFDADFFIDQSNNKDSNNIDSGGNKLLISDTAKIAEDVHFNLKNGSIIIQENAVIEAGCIINGPAVIGQNARVKSGTIIYPNVTIGKKSTVCGELNNLVVWGNSTKGHYGYLGCAVVGEGCNLGAGTTNSNLRNDWSDVKLYSYKDSSLRNTGLLKCGVIIGDHCMLAICSKINTGTVIGVGCQIALSNFIPKFVPDFSWVTDSNFEKYIFSKFTDTMVRKSIITGEELTEYDKEILEYTYKQTLHLKRN